MFCQGNKIEQVSLIRMDTGVIMDGYGIFVYHIILSLPLCDIRSDGIRYIRIKILPDCFYKKIESNNFNLENWLEMIIVRRKLCQCPKLVRIIWFIHSVSIFIRC